LPTTVSHSGFLDQTVGAIIIFWKNIVSAFRLQNA